MASKLIIKSHHPWRHRSKIAALVLGLVAVIWGVYQFGHSSAGFDYGALLQERTQLREQVVELKQGHQELRERVAILDRAAQVDKQAYGEVERSLKQAQDEMLELKEEVAFYRGIVAPSETSSGLNIADFRVTRLGEERAFRFKLVLTQVKTNSRVVTGYVRVAFEGVRDGAQVELDLKEVSGGALDRLKLRFKYFQNNEGEFVLPAGFLPSRVLVEVVPSGDKSLTRLQKTFDWSDIVS